MARHRCPVCTGPLIPMICGFPGGDLAERYQRGEVMLGGCCLPTFGPALWCPACQAGRDYECPVCGYGRLLEAPWGDDDLPSAEPCPCCGTRFGVDTTVPGWDDPAHRRLRQQWVDGGCRWSSTQIRPPRRWTPHRQLERVDGL